MPHCPFPPALKQVNYTTRGTISPSSFNSILGCFFFLQLTSQWWWNAETLFRFCIIRAFSHTLSSCALWASPWATVPLFDSTDLSISTEVCSSNVWRKIEHHMSLWLDWNTQALLQRRRKAFFGYEWPLYELPHDMVPQEVQYVRKFNLSPASSCFFPSCHFLPLGVRWRGQLSWTRSGKCWPAQAPLPPSAPSLLSRHRPAHPGSERGWREW